MRTFLIICCLVVISLIIKACNSPIDNGQNNTSTPTVVSPPSKVDNYKIVVIKGANYNDIKKAVQQFCDIYNQQDYAAIPSLTKIADSEFVITFPHGLTFDIFCFFVNYMYYPNNIFYKADIKAWATTKPTDTWITEKSANKKVMLYIPADDDEHDNVYLTTQDNIGYKLGFAVGHEKQLLDNPKEKYVDQPIIFNDIQGKPTEEIK